jgi:hypothetical protein
VAEGVDVRPLLEIQEAILARGGEVTCGEDGFQGKFHIGPRGYATQAFALLIVSVGGGWDHVSVSMHVLNHRTREVSQRCASWEEMDHIKRICFLPFECVMQLHPPLDQYITGTERRVFTNGARRKAVDPTPVSKYVLHLCRPQAVEIPTPPIWMV